ncbi:choline TMA-lyase-activating enzyme [Parendozoicomonas haliclonae]|uniref:Choline trimethylamine-lyase activating enzyme n=1 Tax=Parendozoicomonas haliclonae TaxID=1960125 RepID=A0A1X7AK97_9GAMM|nr:choline TMA-lyase-activating enzyme [Parendozoicomonas haliclonae]SMA46672.1 Benzylsuccinate synthase activating enzyme [Parendozoicomonas haliclonae]
MQGHSIIASTGSDQELRGRIFNIQKYSIYDGDGIRTLVFFKGCNIRCPWCANPESISYGYQVMFNEDNCVKCGRCVEVCPVGVHTPNGIDRTVSCIGCRKCEEVCIGGALKIMGQDMTVQELMDVIMQDYNFYLASNGGVTLSGGECTLQADFAAKLLAECKRMQINTAIETNGSTALENYEKLAPFVDLFLFDIKHINSINHNMILGMGNEPVRRNLERLVELNANIVIRMPLIPGYNDSYDAITGAFEYVMDLAKRNDSIKRIDVLPYHQMGKTKYDMLGIDYPAEHVKAYSGEQLAQLEMFFKTFDFDIRLVRH